MSDGKSNSIAPGLLTLKQAAEFCQVSERTFWSWSHSGLAPAPRKIGLGLTRRVTSRYSHAELVAWIADGCPPVVSPANGAAD